MEILFSHERLDDFLIVEQQLINNRLIIDPNDTQSERPCRLINYSLEKQFNYFCLLDRNIVSYLISIIKGRTIKHIPQDSCYILTAGLQAFLNAAGIVSDPAIAYHEYIDSTNIDHADEELSYFRSADNYEPRLYLDIAVGKRFSIDKTKIKYFKPGELKNKDIPESLKHFNFNIIFIKKALTLKAQGLSNYQVMLELIDWTFEYYLFSAAAFHFLTIYFSAKRISKMLKTSNIKDINNATWDLTFIQQIISLSKNNNQDYWLFSTFDKAIKKTVDLAFINAYESELQYFSRLEHEYSAMWGKSDDYGTKLLEKYLSFKNCQKDKNRKFNNLSDSVSYIKSLRKNVDIEYQKYVTK